MSPLLSDHFLMIPTMKEIWDKTHRMHIKKNEKRDISHFTINAINLTQRE